MGQAFLRPIEITTANEQFTVSYDGGGAATKNIPQGTYGSILTLLYQIDDLFDNTAVTGQVYINSDWKVVFDAGGGHTFTVIFSDVPLAIMLGFTDNTIGKGGRTETATYTPTHMWQPTYVSRDQERWKVDQRKRFWGAKSVNGRIAGISSGTTLYERSFNYEHETAVKTYEEAATLSFAYGGTTYYPEVSRNFETFIDECRTVQSTSTDAVNPKGFYYLPDDTVYTGASPSVALPSSMNSGGIAFDLASSPDYYVFCTPNIDGDNGVRASLPVGNSYYSIGFDATTATAPTWDAP